MQVRTIGSAAAGGGMGCFSSPPLPLPLTLSQFFFNAVINTFFRATSGQVGSNSYPEHGLVKDGTPCGDNLICLNQTCVSLFPHVDQTKCPTNKQGQECSEHGVSYLSGGKTPCIYALYIPLSLPRSFPLFCFFFLSLFAVLHQRQPMLLRHGLGRHGLQHGGIADHATANGGIANAGEYN